MKKKLYIRMRGTTGDFFHYLARMKDVRKHYPDHWIKAAVVSPIAFQLKELLKLCSYFDEIEILGFHETGFTISEKFRKKIKREIGEKGKFLNFVIPGYPDVSLFNIEIGWRPVLSKNWMKWSNEFYGQYVGGNWMVVLHMVSSKNKGSEWQWGKKKYRRLINLIRKDYPCKILIVGDMAPLFLKEQKNIIDLSSNNGLGIELGKLLGLILKADCVIGGDSGFQILPWLAGIPVISLVPAGHIEGHKIRDERFQGKSISVGQFLPSILGKKSGSVIFPVKSTSADTIYKVLKELDIKEKPEEKEISSYVRTREKGWFLIKCQIILIKYFKHWREIMKKIEHFWFRFLV